MNFLRSLKVLAFLLCSLVANIQSVKATIIDYASEVEVKTEFGSYENSDKSTRRNQKSVESCKSEIGSIGYTYAYGLAEALTDPNDNCMLRTKITRDYKFSGFYMNSYSYTHAQVNGDLQITKSPNDSVCLLKIEVEFPSNNFTGTHIWDIWSIWETWEVSVQSDSGHFVCGENLDGPYGEQSGQIFAYPGENIHVNLQQIGCVRGVFPPSYEISDSGSKQVDVHLTPIPMPADLTADGNINLHDFKVLSSHWLETDCDVFEDPNFAWCEQSDIDGDGDVGIEDLDYLSAFWCLNLDPNLPGN